MKQSIAYLALLVNDYDEAIEFFAGKLNFDVLEDTYVADQNKRWVLIAPPNSNGTAILLAKATAWEQERNVGNQSGGRVFLFLHTDDFWRDYNDMISKGIEFVREPKKAEYGTVAVFRDLYGNLWDLLELNSEHPLVKRMA